MTKVIMATNIVFSNPNNVAIEDLKLTINNDGVVKSVPAIDPFWVTKRALTIYTPPPSGTKIGLGAIQTWKETMQWFIDDLKWLLSQRYHEFWSNIVYYSPCMDMLVSFLQEAFPPYLLTDHDKSVMDLYNEAYKKVLVVFSRLITNKESEAEWMTTSHLGQLLYNKFIFTIPIIFDLCLLYGINNSAHLSKMIKTVFYLQPKYSHDLVEALGFLKQIFNFIALQADNRNNMDVVPPTLPEVFKGFSQAFGGLNSQSSVSAKTLSSDSLRDLTLHLVDCALTIRLYLDLYPPSRHLFRENDFHTSIVNLYENTIPQMYEKLFEFGDPKKQPYSEVLDHLDLIRAEFIDSFRLIIATTIDDILSISPNMEQNVNTYLTIITDAISEKAFIKDYNEIYSVEADLDIICQAYTQMDPVKCDFILQAVMANCIDDDFPTEKPPTSSQYEQSDHISNGFHVENGTASNQEIIHNTNIPEEAKTQSLISEVKDILPHLGDGFILKCLQHYEFNSERVINSILENSLDESLRKIDKSLPIIPDDPLDVQFIKTGIDRLNVFDNDEFDVMTRDDIDPSKVHKGKKKYKHKNLADMLNDKSHIKEMKDVYQKYDLVSDEPDIYDDEYDDTYDSGTPDLVSEVSAEADRRNVFKRLRINHVEECAGESEDDEEEPSSSGPPQGPRDAFCVNPEEVRARYQARRDIKYGHKPDRDVVGRAKGQGQEKDVLLNRQKKGANKSIRGNHNRRGGAQWKRNQGMLPS